MLPLLMACRAPLPDALSRPNGVVVGPDGRVYVSDFLHDRIVVFDADGAFVATWGSSGLGRDQLWRVYGMALDTDGALLVANGRPLDARDHDENAFEIKRFVDGRSSGELRLDQHIADGGQIAGIAVHGERVLVADPAKGDLFLVDRQGRFVGRLGGAPRSDAAPSYVELAGDDVYVVEQNTHRVRRVTAEGVDEVVPLEGGVRFPIAAAVCPGRSIAVADLGNYRIARFGLDGRLLGTYEPERAREDAPVQLLDVATDALCTRLYAADSKGDRVLVLTVEGEHLQTLDRW